MNENKLYYSAQEVKDMLGLSRSKAYSLCRELNAELAKKGYITVPGRVPKAYLHEKYYGLAQVD